ncbi:WG repeat-containing protein [Chryseosolibacter indicus]|uniref:WG repeat-containing protein n=1 Tax=Chryseosolibacter indicus TaxID=2782351 RepID=A0ABS5VW75_9BACT|nr:WG repeat-containing protein [Chryseosolibacter indicus]MBT1705080.1 WG repeat-containing protein [Chryseosolibacter indicus]
MSRFFLAFITFLLLICQASPAKPFGPSLNADFNRYQENGKVGLKNQKGDILIPAKYDALGWSNGEFSVVENVIGYQLNGYWGLISLNNNRVTKNEFVDLSPGSGNIIVARKKLPNSVTIKTGCLTPTGKVIVPFLYDGLSVTALRAIVYDRNGLQFKHGLIDFNNKVLIPLNYQAIYPLGSLRFGVVAFDNKTAIFSDDGKQLTTFTIDSISSFKKNYAVIYQNHKQGLINRDGQIKLEPAYREVVIEDNGTVKVRQADGWLFLKGDNKLIREFRADSIEPALQNLYKIKTIGKVQLADKDFKPLTNHLVSSVGPFNKGKAIYKLHDNMGLLKSDGTIVIEAKYNNFIFDDDRIRASFVRSNTTEWCLLDTLGKSLTERKYDFIAPYNGAFYPVKRKDYWGGLNKQGKEIIACVHDSIKQYLDNYIIVKFKGQYGIINTNENWIVAPQRNQLELVSNERYLERSTPNTFLKSMKSELIYFTENKVVSKADHLLEYLSTGAIYKINLNGLIADRFYQPEGVEEIFTESEEYRAIKKDGKYGFIDSRSRLRIANRYDNVRPFNEGLAPIKLLGRWGFINKEDRIAVQPLYDDVSPFKNGFSVVRKGDMFGLIDKTGKLILPVRYEAIDVLPTKRFLIKQNGLFGAVDSNGRVILTTKYQSVKDLANDYLIVEYDNKWGVISTKGISTIPLIYDGILYDKFHDEFLALKRSEWQVAQIQ